MNNIIQLSNINKSFDNSKKIKVLKKISFKFQKGKIYSLMGPSGSGKSTLLNLLSLIDRPSSGSILIENKLINFNNSSKNDILRAKKIGIIYQQDNLLPDFTAIENIYLAGLSAGNSKEISKSKAKNLLKKVGLTKRTDHFPSELSGGEKQRISIARALINNPQIILADEPTGNLDPKKSIEIVNLLKKININGSSVIIATHDYDIIKSQSGTMYECCNKKLKKIDNLS